MRSHDVVETAAVRAPAKARASRRILIATDFSPCGDSAVRWAYARATSEADLVLVHVLDYALRSELALVAIAADLRRAQRRALARLAALEPRSARGRGVRTIRVVLAGWRPAEAICDVAERHQVDVICIGRFGESDDSRAMLGTTAQGIVRRSRLPVLLLPGVDDLADRGPTHRRA